MRARVFSGLLLLIALASPAFAADRQAEGGRSFDRILPEIRRHTPGTFYDAEGPFVGQDGQSRYRIKWMTPEGRIIWYEVDARNGHILGRVTGTLPVPSSRYGRDSDGYLPPYSSGDDAGPPSDYSRGRRGRDGNDGNSNHFGDWPGYDRGQSDREGRYGDREDRGGRYGDRDDRGRRDGDGGSVRRGGSDRGNSGRGDSRRGRRGRD
jgi:hypothetical protein